MSQILEIAAKDCVFHFNKKHLENPSIPMWVLKCKGESWYVNHVECNVPWSTKETEDNLHTKGSIKVKDCLLQIDNENCATISKLTLFDKIRLRNQKLGITRIMWTNPVFEKILKGEGVRHSPFKRVYGACGTAYSVCDLLDGPQATMLSLKYPKTFRVLMPNEPQYRAYDDSELWEKLNDEYADDDEN